MGEKKSLVERMAELRAAKNKPVVAPKEDDALPSTEDGFWDQLVARRAAGKVVPFLGEKKRFSNTKDTTGK